MTKSSENRKINAKTREWDADKAWLNDNWHRFWKSIKNIIKEEKNNMMYGKKETNRIDRFAYEIGWWFKMFIIICAFEYIFRR